MFASFFFLEHNGSDSPSQRVLRPPLDAAWKHIHDRAMLSAGAFHRRRRLLQVKRKMSSGVAPMMIHAVFLRFDGAQLERKDPLA